MMYEISRQKIEIRSLINYDVGTNETYRVSTDKGINNYGKHLINLCKTTDLRIVNGRKEKDRQSNVNIAFYNVNSTSTKYYLLTEVNSSGTTFDFSTGYYNIFSDHVLLVFSIKLIVYI